MHILFFIINLLTRRFLRLRGLLVSGKVLPLPFGCFLFLLLPASSCQLKNIESMMTVNSYTFDSVIMSTNFSSPSAT